MQVLVLGARSPGSGPLSEGTTKVSLGARRERVIDVRFVEGGTDTYGLEAIAHDQQPGQSTSQHHWTLGQEFPVTGDGSSPALFLDSITRQGQDTADGGGSVTLPPVTFTPVQLAIRVNPGNYPALVRFRIGAITTETGSRIGVTYEQPSQCNRSSYPTPSSNTTSCFPVYWQHFTPSTGPDWFIKYTVQSVSVSDPAGGSPAATPPTPTPTPGLHRTTTTTSSWQPDTAPTGSGAATTM